MDSKDAAATKPGLETHDPSPSLTHRQRPLSAAAHRALAEASERREAAERGAEPEVNGRGGLDPARYGDWEVKGLASDF